MKEYSINFNSYNKIELIHRSYQVIEQVEVQIKLYIKDQMILDKSMN